VAALALAAILAGFAEAQSIIQTVLGGSPVDVPALAATLNSPVGVAVDANGKVYVAVQGLNQVVEIDRSGLATVFAGTGANSFSGDSGPAVKAALNNPVGLAVDADGNLYIADSRWEKPIEEWSAADLKRILSDSPWARFCNSACARLREKLGEISPE
jgi:DNA-binding beta-propeller fold protein YncE